MATFNQGTKGYQSQMIPTFAGTEFTFLTTGAMLTNLPVTRPAILPPATCVNFQIVAGTEEYQAAVTPLFYVLEAVSASATTVKIMPINDFSLIDASTKVMLFPDTVDATGKGVTVGTLTPLTGADVGGYSFTISAAGLSAAEIPVGKFLTTATATGNSAKVALPVSGLVFNEENLVTDTYAVSISIVDSAEVYASRVRIPDAVYKAFNTIKKRQEGGVK